MDKEFEEENISKEDFDKIIKKYPKELITEYLFDNIDFTKLSKDDTYLISIEVGDETPKENVHNFCRALKNALEDKGFTNTMLIPLRNGLPLITVNANPSEALECLDRLEYYHKMSVHDLGCKEHRLKDIKTIKQTLIKAQEQNRVLEVIFEKNVDVEMIKLYRNYNDYCIGKEKYLLRKDLWLTEEEFNLIKRYCNKKGE